jgi:hypothetical protein
MGHAAGGEFAMGKVVTVTAANFESEVLRSEVPVMVDDWAP